MKKKKNKQKKNNKQLNKSQYCTIETLFKNIIQSVGQC